MANDEKVNGGTVDALALKAEAGKLIRNAALWRIEGSGSNAGAILTLNTKDYPQAAAIGKAVMRELQRQVIGFTPRLENRDGKVTVSTKKRYLDVAKAALDKQTER